MSLEVIEFLKKPAGWTFTGALLTGACALAAFTYGVGKDVGQGSAEALKSANQLNLKTLTTETSKAASDLRSATAEFRTEFDAKRKYDELSKKFNEQTEKLREMTGRESNSQMLLSSKSQELDKIKAQLESITDSNKSVRVSQGQAVLVANGALSVSITNTFYDGVELNFNGERKKVQAGDRLQLQLAGGLRCWIRVDQVKWDYPASATLVASCRAD